MVAVVKFQPDTRSDPAVSIDTSSIVALLATRLDCAEQLLLLSGRRFCPTTNLNQPIYA
jgi:hypothetical protein